mgnify:CR=1 FL=1
MESRARRLALVGLAGIAVTALLLLGVTTRAVGDTAPPMVIYGEVYIDGALVASGGLVEAEIDEVVVADALTNEFGQYGMSIEGHDGEGVHFFVDGVVPHAGAWTYVTPGFRERDLYMDRARLSVALSAPQSLDIGSEFTTVGVITNSGDAASFATIMTLTVSGPAVPQSGGVLTRTLGDLAGGSSEGVSWDLICTGPGGVTLTTALSGEDESTGLTIPADRLHPAQVSLTQWARTYMPLAPKLAP